MKKTLCHFIMAALAAAFITPAAVAQPYMGGDDVKVLEINQNVLALTKTCVADNGWIYLMTFTGRDTDNSHVTIFCSKDHGSTYQKMAEWNAPSGYRFQDFDIEVTGSTESDIRVWSAEILNKPGQHDSKVAMFRRDANVANAVSVYQDVLPGVTLYDISIASNYRAPAPNGNGGDPFALAIAVSGYNNASSAKHSFLDYVVSMDGGATYEKHLLHTINGEKKISRVDLSIGSSSESMGHNTWPFMGVAFEMNSSDIGFFYNFVDYDNDYAMDAPIKLNSSTAYDPHIKLMLDPDTDNEVGGELSHNFIVTFSQYDDFSNDWDVWYAYPLLSFGLDLLSPPTVDDMEVALFTNTFDDETNSEIQYDKATSNGNNYLVTYAKAEADGTRTMRYRWLIYQDLGHKDNWSDIYTYARTTNDYYTPSIDINPTKGKVCWSWIESMSDKRIVWSDTEWVHATDMEAVVLQEGTMKLFPNPAKDYAQIEMPAAGDYTATLYDLRGRIVAQVAFSDAEYRLDVRHLARGTYMLRIQSATERFVEKLIVE